MKNKNLIIKNYTDSTYNQYENLFDYLDSKGVKLSYIYGNVFEFFNLDVGNIATGFYKDYFTSLDRTYFKFKYLSDCLLHQQIRTCFTAKEVNEKLFLSKGFKKQFACAVTQNLYGHIFVVSKKLFGKCVLNEDELFNILKIIDPQAETFTITISDDDGVIDMHYAENSITKGNWFHFDEKMEELFLSTKLTSNSKILFVNRTECDINYIEKLANQYKEYNHIVVSFTNTEITLEYLNFIQSDFFLKKKNRIGIGKKLLVFNRYEDGITNVIVDPLT